MNKIAILCILCLYNSFITFSQGNAYALLVGANKIKPGSYSVRYEEASVRKAHEDAAKIKLVLTSAEFKPENIVELTDTSANRKNILSHLDSFSKKLKENDVFVFYYSGHGDTLMDLSRDETPFLYDQALVTYNGYIVDDELNMIWRSFGKGVRLYNIVDACFSGEMYKTLFHGRLVSGQRSVTNNSSDTERCFAYDLSQPFNMYYFGAARKSNTSRPFGDGSGIMTTNLVGKYNRLRLERRIKRTLASSFFENICTPNVNIIFLKIDGLGTDLLNSDYIFKY